MALDVLHSLLVDMPDGFVNRHEVLEKVEHELGKPIASEGSEAIRVYESDRWGTSSEAVASAALWDSMLPDEIPAHGPDEDVT